MSSSKRKPRHLKIELLETITVRDNMVLKSFTGSVKKFVSHVISGWFPSIRKDLSPEGVNKLRTVDRKNNRYQEKITDYQTGRVIRDVDENLTDHK